MCLCSFVRRLGFFQFQVVFATSDRMDHLNMFFGLVRVGASEFFAFWSFIGKIFTFRP
jgi:hypothetical protein